MRGTSLVVLAWNQWALTRRCLDSLFTTRLDHAEVILVDNGSTDETSTAIADYGDRVRYLRHTENLGFVRGMNAGIAAARAGNDVILLNNDLDFIQPDWLGRLQDAAYAAPDHGIVGCRLLGPEPQSLVFHVGGFLDVDNLVGQQTESGQQERDVNQYPRLRRVQGIAFALAYLRRDCIERIGALDELFHSYFEDTDYCLRAQLAGIATVVAGNVTLRHHQHGSTRDDGGFRARLYTESRAAFAERWHAALLTRTRADLVWRGHTRLPSAPSMLARGLVGRLQARNLRVTFLPADPGATNHEDYRLTVATHRPLPIEAHVSFAVTTGAPDFPLGARPHVALLWSEWERLPPAVVDACNALDLVLVPDAVQAELFRLSGVVVPIETVMLGIDREYMHAAIPTLRHPEGRQVFLAIAEDLHRDAPELLIKTFLDSFDVTDSVELIVHIAPGKDAEAIHACVAPIAATSGGLVKLLHGWSFPAAERGQLYAAADVYVSARRGGGWDPFVREAAACGLAVVAPAWGSQKEFVERWGWALVPTRTCADPMHPALTWREVDADELRSTLTEMARRRVEVRALAQSNASDCAERNHLDLTADRLVELLDRTGVLKPAHASPAPHRPGDVARPSGQLVVLGMHRSGTSSVGGLLALFGAWPGPSEHLLRGDDNPKGHFEHGELHMACLRRLASAGGDWKQPPQVAPTSAIDAFRREAADVLDTLDGRRPWFIKEPRLCLLARELLPLLTRPVFVHVVREPLAVADSLARRDDMARDEALALWERYTREAFAASTGWKRVLVDYDDLLADPVATAQRLFDDLVGAGVEGLVRPHDETIRAWIDAPARAPSLLPIEALTAAQAALRAACVDRSILDRADAG